MMAMSQSQLIKVLKEGRRELILSGEEISEEIEKDGLDPSLFSAIQLNYLSIDHTKLEVLPPGIGELCNLVNLVLHTNSLKELPSQIGKLKNLKHLDVSKNNLVELPTEISNLKEIATLNVSFNRLTKIPSLKSNKKLHFLDLSYNKFEIFPDILYSDLNFLAELKLDGNKIKCIPASIRLLTSLKTLSVNKNLLCNLPLEVGHLRLKDVKFNDNPFSDKNLKKIISGGNTKKILEFIRKHCPSTAVVEETTTNNDDSASTPHEGDIDNTDSEESGRIINHNFTKYVRSELVTAAVVTRMERFVQMRRFILCCVIKNVQFNTESFRNFLRIQNLIHRQHCGDRSFAAIGTHDFDKLSHKSIIYTCKDPKSMFLTPLGSDREMSAADFIIEQKSKAKKLSKRQQNSSGILKYVHMLEGLQTFPCLMTEDGADIISLPPVTNCESSKISLNTKNIFVEITSHHSQVFCKAIMESLLFELLTLGIGDHELKNENGKCNIHLLQLASVVINNSDGSLFEQYPSLTDLQNFPDDVKITYVC